MRSHFLVFALTALLVLSIGVSPTFAQIEEAIVVTTEQSSYQEGDKIMVSGEVKEILSGFPVTLQVIAANGNLVTIEQLDIGTDRTFSTTLTAGGVLWKSQGTYTIKVLYGTEARTASTTFVFGGTTGIGTTPSGQPLTEGEFGITFHITGGSVVSITPVPEEGYGSLIIVIDTVDDGELTITLPREVIDAKLNGDDDDFIVLVDAEEWDYDETKTDLDRTLTIGFLAGTTEIEIIGTFVIPEFGTIAALILAVAIISIIAVSARTKLSIMPKY